MENHETVLVLKVHTKIYLAGAWLFTKLYLVMSVCVNSAWDTLVRFMACGGGGCVLNILSPSMTTVRAFAGIYGVMDGCVIISIATSLKDGEEVMYVVVFPPSHRGPRYLDIPFRAICFISPTPPLITTLTIPKTMNSVAGNVVPEKFTIGTFVA